MPSVVTTYDDIVLRLKRDLRLACLKFDATRLYNELVEDIPDAIALAEERMNRELRVASMEQGVSDATSDGAILIPADFLEAISLKTTGPTACTLKAKSYHFVKDILDNSTDPQPLYYARQGPEFIVAPAPTDGTDIELYYYASETPLASANQTNYWSENFSDLILSGAMEELTVFIDIAMSEEYRKKHERRVARIQEMDDAMELSGSSISQSSTGDTP